MNNDFPIENGYPARLHCKNFSKKSTSQYYFNYDSYELRYKIYQSVMIFIFT